MNKYKYLFKNIGLLTLSSFATKLLSFFLVPLYTNILTTTEYGTYDLFNTTVGVLLPILTLNVQDAKDFFVAWKYVPWLTIAIVFGSLSGYIGGFFSAVKNSKIFAQSTVVGAVSNIVLNLVMTPFMGALGAAIATAVCYFVVWVIRYWHSKKIIKLKINFKRDLITYVLLAAQSIVLLLEDGIALYGVEIGMFLVIVILYAGDLMSIAKKGKQAVQR